MQIITKASHIINKVDMGYKDLRQTITTGILENVASQININEVQTNEIKQVFLKKRFPHFIAQKQSIQFYPCKFSVILQRAY